MRALVVSGVVLAAGVFAGLGAAGPRAVQPATAAAAGAYSIDGGHSAVIFKISHLGVSNFYGRFNSIGGSFTLDAATPESGSVNVTLKADSIDTAIADRDRHLKSPDFFNAKEFADITFASKRISKNADGTLSLEGDLTLLGQTKPITAKLVHFGEKDAGGRMGKRSGIEATFAIKRSDFGMKFMTENGMLGDEVTVIAALEGTKK